VLFDRRLPDTDARRFGDNRMLCVAHGTVVLFLAGGAAVLHQRSEQPEAKYRAASATTPYGLSLRRRILRLRSMRQAPHFRENIRSGRASD
jgi:hypothetical protein